MKLHLGCGDIYLKGFVNIDLVKTKAAEKLMDVRDLKYPDDSVDFIYSAHVLEHFSQKELVPVLKEWRRVLKAGGTILAVTPNFNLHLKQFLTERLKHLVLSDRYWDPVYIFEGKWLKSKKPFVISNNLIADISGGGLEADINTPPEAYHKVIYDPGTFENFARLAGFKKINQVDLKSINYLPNVKYKSSKLHYSSMAFELTK